MKKPFKKQQDQFKQTVFSNTHEAQFNPNKLTKYYGVIEIGSTSFIITVDAKFRSEALAILEEESRLLSGKLTTIGVFK